MNLRLLAALLLSSAAITPVLAENSRPQPVPYVDTIPAARDVPYPGMMTLDIDATDTERGIFTVKETLTVAGGGHMVLLFPKWLPGAHSPRGELDKLAGVRISSGGKRIAWTRDPVDVFAYHIDVPQGAKALDIDLQFISATKGDQGSIVMSPAMLRLQPNSMSLYPAGYFTRQIPVKMTVKYPEGFKAASGLPSKAVGSTYSYDLTSYETLVDSPILAGRYYKAFELTPRVTLDTFADTPEQLAAKPEQIAAHTRLVEQAVKAFGAQHYDHYHFLLSISDQMGGIGLEHHRSSEDGTRPGYFTEWDSNTGSRNLLPHEFTHSWDGKFRRGADLWTPDYRTPMRGSLLWVYEGQTQFWGYVLQARSGLVSKQDTLDQIAATAAYYDTNPARQWRDLVDTTNDPVISSRRPKGWTSWQRSEDYYSEGQLVWLEVDSLLREQSKGTKSIDDFAQAFFGINDGDWGEVTYTLDDVAATLNTIQPYDWKGLLTRRLTEHGEGAPLSGLTRNGYRLVYTDTPAPTFKQGEKTRKTADFTYSVGFVVNPTGELTSVLWQGPAFAQGLTIGDTIIGVNGMTWSDERMRTAIIQAKDSKEPIRLLVKAGERLRDIAIDYHGGPRYPHLEKIGSGETGLDRLLAAK
ncbi:PDZ domain-containing protein [Sphingomonas sp. AR_OL41]|uniref:M61 family metallopeptidase n=1 Tax=Sphingomonas sp. AR_OL41 TaxID=3042729 RepID=UPI00248084C6|nr:PDZ domain-containing protein [Sphingomonas sp. AR_OL41]MDH7973749.1 PDZ domain-containing protein [Sphingomonas sp. AR_OL41]